MKKSTQEALLQASILLLPSTVYVPTYILWLWSNNWAQSLWFKKYKLMLWCGGPKEIIVLYAQQPRITGTLLVKLQNEFILKWQEAIKSALTILRAVSG